MVISNLFRIFSFFIRSLKYITAHLSMRSYPVSLFCCYLVSHCPTHWPVKHGKSYIRPIEFCFYFSIRLAHNTPEPTCLNYISYVFFYLSIIIYNRSQITKLVYLCYFFKYYFIFYCFPLIHLYSIYLILILLNLNPLNSNSSLHGSYL